MFGRNILLSKRTNDDGLTLDINEIFPTLQGEGPFAGRPAVFVRLAGCNLACRYCDTEFEVSVPMHVGDVVRQVRDLAGGNMLAPGFRATLVVITGGEPLRQNIVPLVRELTRLSLIVQIETAGTLWQDGLLFCVHEHLLVCSPKTPKVNPRIESHCRHWKYIVAHDDCDPTDGLPVRATQGAMRTTINAPVFRSSMGWRWVQPRYDYMPDGTPDAASNAKNVKHAVDIAMRYDYRLSLQQHKLLNLP